jgi:hypothetical protein
VFCSTNENTYADRAKCFHRKHVVEIDSGTGLDGAAKAALLDQQELTRQVALCSISDRE